MSLWKQLKNFIGTILKPQSAQSTELNGVKLHAHSFMEFSPPKRFVNKVYVHCTASDDVTLACDKLVAAVRSWHLARGFEDIGYHFIIDKQGTLLRGRPIEEIPAAQQGNNTGSLAVCVHGLENFTPASLSTLQEFCYAVDEAYEKIKLPVTFHGHCEVSPKTCPVFDYRKLLDLDKDGRML